MQKSLLRIFIIQIFIVSNLYSGEILFEVKDDLGNPIMSVQDDGIWILNSDGDTLMTVNNDSIRFGIDSAMQRSFAIQQSGSRTIKYRANGANVFKIADADEVENFEGPMMLWYPQKEAFRVGNVLVEGASNVGLNSFATGFKSQAIGNYSQAMGYECISGSRYSTALGYRAVTNGEGALAVGFNAKALSPTAIALGRDVEANEDYSTAIGNTAIADGNYSLAIGRNTNATTAYSTAIGTSTDAEGEQATAIGVFAKATGNYSSAFGQGVRSLGTASTAIGSNNTAAHASSSLALGYNINAFAKYSTAIGYNTDAYGRNSTAIGSRTTSASAYSFVTGRYNILEGDSLNWIYYDPLFVVGNGSSSAVRNNAFTIYKDGDAKLDGGLSLEVGTEVNEFSTDGTLAGNSVYVVPTERAVKTYVDANSSPAAMIPVAIGNISSTGVINSGSGVNSCSWNSTYSRYEIQITGITYDWDTHITMVTPMSGGIGVRTGSVGGKLLVTLYTYEGNKVQGAFQFVTYNP